MSGFRVFDKQEKKYISESLQQYFLNHEGKLIFAYLGEGTYDDLHNELDPDRYVVEFSTGLKDNNGVEIFAGDSLTDTDGFEYEVRWDENDAMFILSDSSVCWDFSQLDSKDFKIIGNIHGEAE